ncbi:ATP-binding protein [Paenibacillus terrae]|uniref:(+)RNA virus helicase C-terminal domain-containing protein n=1 Tax=Paenibacillus terrae TaxID=159743 RepID=A0A0D7WT82_9BACL|nr:ATP-binding protein [Paenibacillus terrae]KJD42234.1 hypothetical protein QD47_29425 [Paenibacillus terrae]
MTKNDLSFEAKIFRLMSWGLSAKKAEDTLKKLEGNGKILIHGSVGSGKTRLLNELIRLRNNAESFEYYTIGHYNYELTNDNKDRLSKNGQGDFVVIDESANNADSLIKYLASNKCKCVIFTFATSSIQDIRNMDKKITAHTDIIISMDRNTIHSVRMITIHDRLLYKATEKFDNSKSDLYPYPYIRSEWMKVLSPAQKAAVQLAYMNYRLEDGGLGSWYQGDGEIMEMDIPDLLQLCAIGIEQNIPGYTFLYSWLITVRDEYLPLTSAYLSSLDDKPTSLYDADRLVKQYYSWNDRNDSFDKLLTYLDKGYLGIK